MNNKKILGTGLNGLVGSRVVEILEGKYEFENVSRSTGVDITNRQQVIDAITSSDASIVLHLTAKTDVDGCEKDKELDIRILGYKDIEKQRKDFIKEKTAWAVNVVGTQNVVEGCKVTEKKLIHISTDFIFDGNNTPEGGYSEEDKPNPINWYAVTKYKAEDLVQNSKIPFVIVRPAFPYARPFEKKKDFVQAILSRLQSGSVVNGVTDQLFMPTFIDDIVSALDLLIQSDAYGIYHVVGGATLSPYQAAIAIAAEFNCDLSLVKETTRDIFFKDRAPRPYNLTLKHDKIEKLGIKMKTFEEGLKQLKVQI